MVNKNRLGYWWATVVLVLAFLVVFVLVMTEAQK